MVHYKHNIPTVTSEDGLVRNDYMQMAKCCLGKREIEVGDISEETRLESKSKVA